MSQALGAYAANRSQFSFRVKSVPDETFSVVGFTSRDHRLSGDYHFTVMLSADSDLDPGHVVGREGVLELSWGDQPVPVRGVVARFAWTGDTPAGKGYEAELASPLFPLTLSRHNRVFLGKSVRQIVTEVLQGAGMRPEAFEFKLRTNPEPREFVVQYDESDYDFMLRQLQRHGLFFRFDAGAETTRVLFHDQSEDLPAQPGVSELLYRPRTGTARQVESLCSLGAAGRLLTASVQLKDYHADTPALALEAHARGDSGQGEAYHYGDHVTTLEQAQALARRRQRALDARRLEYLAESDCRGLAPGHRLTIGGHPEASYNGEYLILQVDHAGDQAAGLAFGDQPKGVSYRNRLTLVRADQPWVAEVPAPRRCPGLITARVESSGGGEYAHLDEQGRYRLRLDFDRGDAPKGEASHAVRMVQPHGGENYGLHFPLHAGTEVVLLFENGDLDRPVILGALPNPATPSPVTAANASQHVLRTKGGNELALDDRLGKERIDLFTRERKNILSLDAADNAHQLRLATEEGEMEVLAKKTVLLESGDSQFVQCGNDHEITVENAQRLQTKNKEIELQAATDILCKAGDNIRLQAEREDVELRAGQDMVLDVGESMSVEVRRQDLSLLVDNGNLEIQVAKAATVLGQGGGNILISQGGGSIEISAGGDLTINARRVEINGGSINLKGASIGSN